MVWFVNTPRPHKVVQCFAWSTLLSIPLWLAALMVVKVVIVPELRMVAGQWAGASLGETPAALYARRDPHPLLHAARLEAHALSDAVVRRI